MTMGLFAMPVVYSERAWNQIVGESYYIQLGPQDRFGWTEPEGRVYQIAADNLARLRRRSIGSAICRKRRAKAMGSHRNPAFASSGISRSRKKCCALTATR